MDTKWLEDFVSLAQTRSFSRSASDRHVTQPAFSRRIQSLEAWAGADLVDRSSYPTQLTPAGLTLYGQALELLQVLQSTRTMLRGHNVAALDVVEFAVPHTLAFTFFPHWMSGLRQKIPHLKSRLMALNVHDAVMRLVEGQCDVLIAYYHASQGFDLDTERYEMLSLGKDRLSPFSKTDDAGQALYALPGSARHALPYLAYAPGAYLGGVVEQLLKKSSQSLHLERIYETDMSAALKAMVLAGHGLAFLPQSAVEEEVQSGALVEAHSPTLKSDWSLELEIRAYRERPDRKSIKASAQALWQQLITDQVVPSKLGKANLSTPSKR